MYLPTAYLRYEQNLRRISGNDKAMKTKLINFCRRQMATRFEKRNTLQVSLQKDTSFITAEKHFT